MNLSAKPSDPAPALTRGLSLLRRLDRDGPATLEHLVQATGWPKSSVARMLESLAHAKAVQRDPASRRYHPLMRLVPNATLDEWALRQASAQAMETLCAASRCTVELYAWDGAQLVMIDRREPEQAVVSVQARIGWVRDLAEVDALSQVVRAFHPGEADAWPADGWAWRQGEKARLSAGRIAPLIEQVRATHQAVDLDINEHAVRRYASPLRKDHALVGALAVAQICGPRDHQPDPTLTTSLNAGAQQIRFH